jgi:16S rRNA (uracil1498-N3)-methyltransferase
MTSGENTGESTGAFGHSGIPGASSLKARARCFVSFSDWNRSEAVLGDEESHHLLRVLRVKSGQRVEIFNGEGGAGEAEVISAGRGRVTVRILKRSDQKRSAIQFALIQALPREQKMDLIIQKATELGASEIVPVLTERTVVRLKEACGAGKQDRWEKIALNAAKQCGAAWLPKIAPVQTLKDFLTARRAFGALFVCALDETARPIGEAIQAVKARPVSSVGALVGPEGDFSATEMEFIRAVGAVSVSLGGSVLRSETAAIYVLSILRYEFL